MIKEIREFFVNDFSEFYILLIVRVYERIFWSVLNTPDDLV